MRWLIIAVATAVCAFAGVAFTVAAQTPAQADPAELARESTDALNRGDRSAFLALFTNDAVIEGYPNCYTPCVGTQAVEQEFNLIVGFHVHVTTTSEDVSGNTVTSRFEATSDTLRQLQIDRVVGTFTVTVSGNKISSSSFVLDPNDPQTARILALYEPLRKPSQPAPSAQSLPDTGGRGDHPGVQLEWLALAGASVIGLAAGLGVAAHSRRRRHG